MMKKVLQIIVVGLIITITIISLRPSEPLDKNLVLADELMRDRPDSSLKILEKLNAYKFDGENKALYALLMTQAQFKNYNYPKSDSLIKIAFDFYLSRNDSLRKAQTYFYRARVDENMGNKKEAVTYFQKASISALKTNNYNLLGLIYNRWGMFLRDENLNEDALSIFKKSLDYMLLDNDTLGRMFTLKEMGRVYTLNKEPDLALNCYNSALSLAEIIGNRIHLSKLYNNISLLYKDRGEYNLAMDYINKSLSIKTDSTFIYSCLLLKGDLLTLQQQYDSARYYLNIGNGNSNLFSKATYNVLMSDLEARLGNYKSALVYLNLYIAYTDTIQNLDRKTAIAELQKKYDYSLIKNENDKLKIARQQMQIVILAISLIAIIATFLFLYYYYRKRSIKRTMKLELDKMQRDLMNEKSNYIKEKTIEVQRNLIKEKELSMELSQKSEALKQHHERERELKDYIFQMEAIVQKINTFNSMKPLQRSKSESQFTLSFQELNDLEEAVNLCYDHFADRLRAAFPKLKDDDIHLCCLLKMKVPNKNILSLLDTNELTLKKRRYRIKHDKMNLPDDFSSLEEFLLNY